MTSPTPTPGHAPLSPLSSPSTPTLLHPPTSPALQSAAASLAISRSLSDSSVISAAEQAAVANAAITLSRQSAGTFQPQPISFAAPPHSSANPVSNNTNSDTEPFPEAPYDLHQEEYDDDDDDEDDEDDDDADMGQEEKVGKRRGYMRPQGTNFAASARHRESVLSLGSIAHIQHYFARTGLLDGKGAQLARKNKQARATIDMAHYMAPLRTPSLEDLDADNGKTRHLSMMFGGSNTRLTESPILASSSSSRPSTPPSPAYSDPGDTSTIYSDDLSTPEEMLPPTVSTFKAPMQNVSPPPSINMLKRDLRGALAAATTSLEDALAHKTGNTPRKNSITSTTNAPPDSQSWNEVQGIHILDVMTLAIRAAKVYYTSHEHPERLDSIRPEREVRAELLSVMECLRQMATRGFTGGIKETELGALAGWIAGVSAMLRRDEQLEAAEKAEQRTWTWLHSPSSFTDPVVREMAFLKSIAPEVAADIPEYTPLPQDLTTIELPTPWLASFQNGLKLVQFHNAAVRKSSRRFGAIAAYHRDTAKPYRAADNIRFWAKAAELRWEVPVSVDALAVVYNSEAEAWRGFEEAILGWCARVREEVSADLRGGFEDDGVMN